MTAIHLYSRIDTKDTYLELWGGSTKHPDVMYRFSDYEDKAEWIYPEWLVYQWIIYCASRLTFPSSTYKLVQFAQEYHDTLLEGVRKNDFSLM